MGIIDNVVEWTSFSDKHILERYLKKLELKVKDYCNIDALNEPLNDFIEDKLISIAKLYSKQSEAKDESENGAEIDGVNIALIKSISRGDTSITFKDTKGSEEDYTSDTIDNILNFNKKDIAFLNRHRIVRW